MKRLIIILTLLATGLNCLSQNSIIKGNVYNSNDNKGAAAVIVSLRGTIKGTKTDLNGDFTIDSIPVGTYDLKFSSIGYRDTALTSIKVTQDTIINLKINYPLPCKNSKKDKTCPICKKKNKVIPIIYGLPSKGLLKKAKKGKVRLGGCLIPRCAPKWYCQRDKNKY